MISTKSRITQQRLDRALADIQGSISDFRNWPPALNHLSSIKDYAMGEERFCTAAQALDYCERIKGMLAETAPESAFRNLDAIAEEVRQLQKFEHEATDPLGLLFPVLILIAVGLVIYCLFFQ